MPSQQDPKSARCVPDPFLLLGVGSGDEGIIDSSIVDSDIKIPVPKGLNVTFDPPTAPKIKNRRREPVSILKHRSRFSND